ncbi:hypothetical protein E3E36_08300 [Thermococcus sp. M36]|uniref:hypothetical protein n=1 Tax=Thermococcus sp. M36 TaxID=1638261 RepID=UPI00143A3AE9|nr:hypothetical protein [Thermococcus sp. M36]NJE06139.1 hypothetical protein [Thermococcus sp. M36]
MKMSMKTLLVLFIAALIPMSTAAWAASVNVTTTNTTETVNQTLPVNATNMTPVNYTNTTQVNMTNSTNTTNTTLQTMAYNILVIVDRAANYTEGLMDELNTSDITIPNETLSLYLGAEELRARAWELYNSGNYSESINASMSALYLYKEVVEELTDYYEGHNEKKAEDKDEYHELVLDAKEELHRAAEYFPYVEKVLDEARSEGLNVTQVEELYNATKEAYKVVAQDIANGNFTALKSDLEYAEELMDRLEDAVEKLQEQIVTAKADEISQAFMEKLQEQMRLMQELMAMLQDSTMNATYLTEDLVGDLSELQAMYEQFNALVESGQYEEALDMLHDINEELKDIVEETREIEKEYQEKNEHKEEYEDDNEEHEGHMEKEEDEKDDHMDTEEDEEHVDDEHMENQDEDDSHNENTYDENDDSSYHGQDGDYQEQDDGSNDSSRVEEDEESGDDGQGDIEDSHDEEDHLEDEGE